MSDQPGEDPHNERTRPLGWQQPEPQRGWDAPAARPQSWDPPSDPYATQASGPLPGARPAYPPGAVPYGVPVTDHPSANLALVLGIVGLVGGLTCGLGFLVSPFAWGVGRSALREIRASGGHYGGEGSARAGEVLGIIGTVLLALAVLALVGFVLLFVGLFGAATTTTGNV